MTDEITPKLGKLKPGKRPFPLTPEAAEYERWGLPLGKTIAEWEAEHGLPQYSCYPEAKLAKSIYDPGFFMYRNATDEERELINAARTSNARAKMLDNASRRIPDEARTVQRNPRPRNYPHGAPPSKWRQGG